MGASAATFALSLGLGLAAAAAATFVSAAPMMMLADAEHDPPDTFSRFVSSALDSHVRAARLIVLDVADNFATASPCSRMHILSEFSEFRPEALAVFRARAAAVVPDFELPAVPDFEMPAAPDFDMLTVPSSAGGGAALPPAPGLSAEDAAVRRWLFSLADALDFGLQVYLNEDPPDSASWAAWGRRVELLNWALSMVTFDDDVTLAGLTHELCDRVSQIRDALGRGGGKDVVVDDPRSSSWLWALREPVSGWFRALWEMMLETGSNYGGFLDPPTAALQLAEFVRVDPFERRGAVLARILRGGVRFNRCYQYIHTEGRVDGSLRDFFELKDLLSEFSYYDDAMSERYPERE